MTNTAEQITTTNQIKRGHYGFRRMIADFATLSEAKALNSVALSKSYLEALRSIRCLSEASSDGLVERFDL